MLVLDANILVRAVLGARVLFLLRKYAGLCPCHSRINYEKVGKSPKLLREAERKILFPV